MSYLRVFQVALGVGLAALGNLSESRADSSPAPQSAGSYAATSPSAQASPLPWSDPDNPYCKQGCTYEKSSESLIMLLSYNHEKYEAIRVAKEKGEDALARQAMGGFCLSGEGLDTCWDRYARYQLMYQAKLRAAIARNEDSAARLMSKQVDARTGAKKGDDVPGMAASSPPGGSAKPRSPMLVYLPTLDELQDYQQKQLADNSKKQAAITEQFSRWLDSYPVEPAREDFIKTKRILRDPNDPSRGLFTVIDVGSDGKPLYDDKAYKLALAAYQDQTGKPLALRDKADLKLAYPKGSLPPQELLKPNSKDPNAKVVDGLSRKALAESRGRIVDGVKAKLKQSGYAFESEASTPSMKRAPSAAPSKGSTTDVKLDSSAASQYTGNEKIGKVVGTEANQADSNGLRIHIDYEGRKILRTMQMDVGGTPVQQINGMDLPSISPDD